MSAENTNQKKTSTVIKVLAIPLLVLFIFFEEILLKPMKKIVFPGIEWTIQVSPPWMVITIFSILEVVKTAVKMVIMPYAFTLGFWYGIGAFSVYIIASFFALQIMIHGSQKLRSYAWFNRMYEWVEKTIKPLKKYKDQIFGWFKSIRLARISRVIIRNMKKNKNTFWAKVARQAREWKHSLLTWIINTAQKWRGNSKPE